MGERGAQVARERFNVTASVSAVQHLYAQVLNAGREQGMKIGLDASPLVVIAAESAGIPTIYCAACYGSAQPRICRVHQTRLEFRLKKPGDGLERIVSDG
jgi:hypothetical protein